MRFHRIPDGPSHAPALQLDIFAVPQTAGDGEIGGRNDEETKNRGSAAPESANGSSWLHGCVPASNRVLVTNYRSYVHRPTRYTRKDKYKKIARKYVDLMTAN